MKGAALKIISFYKIFISPALHQSSGLLFGCKFYPTCSEYAEEAIKKYGSGRGTLLGIKRIIKCNPLSHGGIDLLT